MRARTLRDVLHHFLPETAPLPFLLALADTHHLAAATLVWNLAHELADGAEVRTDLFVPESSPPVLWPRTLRTRVHIVPFPAQSEHVATLVESTSERAGSARRPFLLLLAPDDYLAWSGLPVAGGVFIALPADHYSQRSPGAEILDKLRAQGADRLHAASYNLPPGSAQETRFESRTAPASNPQAPRSGDLSAFSLHIYGWIQTDELYRSAVHQVPLSRLAPSAPLTADLQEIARELVRPADDLPISQSHRRPDSSPFRSSATR